MGFQWPLWFNGDNGFKGNYRFSLTIIVFIDNYGFSLTNMGFLQQLWPFIGNYGLSMAIMGS